MAHTGQRFFKSIKMKFSELNNGDFVYIFNAENCECAQRKVTAVSPQKFDNQRGLVIDVSIEGFSTPFVCSVNADSATANLLTISPNRERIKAVTDSCKEQLKTFVNNFDKIKANIAQCEKNSLELDPTLKQQQEMSAEILSMKSEIAELKQLLKDFMK